MAPWLMERQLDDVAGKMLQQSLQDRGMQFLIGAADPGTSGQRRQRQGRPRHGRAVQGWHHDHLPTWW